jgi:hypothetical protein
MMRRAVAITCRSNRFEFSRFVDCDLFGFRVFSLKHLQIGNRTSCSLGASTHLRGRQYDLGELAQPLLLLFDQKLGITDQIDEQDVTNLERYAGGLFRWDIHLLGPISSLPARSCWKPGLSRIGSQTGSILSR